MKRENSLLKPVLPREHGVLTIAFIPLLTAYAISFPGSGNSFSPLLWFSCAVIFFFMSFSPFTTILKKGRRGRDFTMTDRNFVWAVAYIVLSLFFFSYLLISSRLWGLLLFLIPIGAVFFFYCHLLKIGENRNNLTMDLLGALALCIVAPMAYYVSLHRLDISALMIYILNGVFFASRIIFTKQMIDLKENDVALKNFRSRRNYFKRVSLYNVVAIHVLVLLSMMKMIPTGAVTSLLPASIYTWKQIITLKQKPKIRAVGLKELGVALFFSVVLIYSYTTGWPLE